MTNQPHSIAVKLLDCTLRDGGYINGWKWGKNTAKDIIHNLTKARIDIVEVGFLRDIDCYNPDISVGNRIEEQQIVTLRGKRNRDYPHNNA